jgi:hypothetical protein
LKIDFAALVSLKSLPIRNASVDEVLDTLLLAPPYDRTAGTSLLSEPSFWKGGGNLALP